MVGHEWWCDQGVIRGRCERYVAECCLEDVRDEWRKEIHEKSKLSMMKRITECEVRSSCAFLMSKAERRMC